MKRKLLAMTLVMAVTENCVRHRKNGRENPTVKLNRKMTERILEEKYKNRIEKKHLSALERM